MAKAARAKPIPKTGSRPKAKIVKAAIPKRTTKAAPAPKNSEFLSDDRLTMLITNHAKDAGKHSKAAGEGSVAALRRYHDIGDALLTQKGLGKFKKPHPSIREWCNEHLQGVIGDTNPYGMAALTMTLAKPGRGNKPGLYKTLMDHVAALEKAGKPIGPLGINSALALARSLARGEGGEGAGKPKASRKDRLTAAVERLRGFQELVREMLADVNGLELRSHYEKKMRELVPVELEPKSWNASIELAARKLADMALKTYHRARQGDEDAFRFTDADDETVCEILGHDWDAPDLKKMRAMAERMVAVDRKDAG